MTELHQIYLDDVECTIFIAYVSIISCFSSVGVKSFTLRSLAITPTYRVYGQAMQ